MGRIDDDAVPSPPFSLAAARLAWNPLPLSVMSLLRALKLASLNGWGFEAIDVARVEASWELLDDSSTAHGFVLAFRDGTRRYLQYIVTYDGDDGDEDVLTLPMRDERYPPIEGGGIDWHDDAGDLSRLFTA
jgi:hypothetical protein